MLDIYVCIHHIHSCFFKFNHLEIFNEQKNLARDSLMTKTHLFVLDRRIFSRHRWNGVAETFSVLLGIQGLVHRV